jgi:hypothetical protein
MEYEELDIKIRLCGHLGIRPVFELVYGDVLKLFK